METLDALLVQARQRRFTDPTREARFVLFQVRVGLLRLRWALVAAIGISLALAIVDDLRLAHAPELRGLNRTFRFLVQFPIWMALLGATWWPRAHRSLDLWIGLGVGAMIQWIVLMFPFFGNDVPAYILIGQALPVTVLTLFVLPARFRSAMVLAISQGLVAPVLLVWIGAGLLRDSIWASFPTNLSFAMLAAMFGFLRERDARRLFAQQEHLVALNAELARLNAERAEFMAIAAHDVQAPLNAVKITAQLARAEPTAPGPARAMLEDIATAASRMGAIVGSFLRVRPADSGVPVAHPSGPLLPPAVAARLAAFSHP
jgi:signal transduction histidine kinase